MLLERAEALAREQGCYRIQLTSRVVREDAHRFYEAHGYVPSHRGFKKLL
jgi:GNAT superfamily N-acetyltransferase